MRLCPYQCVAKSDEVRLLRSKLRVLTAGIPDDSLEYFAFIKCADDSGDHVQLRGCRVLEWFQTCMTTDLSPGATDERSGCAGPYGRRSFHFFLGRPTPCHELASYPGTSQWYSTVTF